MQKKAFAKTGFKPTYDLKPATFLFCFYRKYRNNFLVSSFSFESDNSVSRSKQCIVSTASNIETRMNLCATLSVQNVSSLYNLSVRSLCSQSLGLGSSAVLCRTNSLFMSEELKVHL